MASSTSSSTTEYVCTWKQLKLEGEVPIVRSSHGLSVYEDTAVLYGGENIARIPIDNSVTSINLKNGICRVLFDAKGGATQPPLRVAHAQAFIGSSLCIFGGRQGIKMNEEALSDMWMFDINECKWTQVDYGNKDAAPCARSFHKVVGVDQKLYVFGGCGASGRLADLYEFDTKTALWEKLPSFSKISGRGGAGFAKSSDNSKLFVVGGFSGVEMNDIFAYDIKTQAWSEISPGTVRVPKFSVSSSATLHVGQEGVIVFFGGEVQPSEKGHEGAGKFSNSIICLNALSGQPLENDTFTMESAPNSTLPQARGWACADVFDSTQLIVFGGLSGSDSKPIRLNDLWALKIDVKEK